MITKQDCLSILTKLDDEGVKNVNPYLHKVLLSKEVPVDVLKFIASNQGLEAVKFYEVIRKAHNKNKSPLYTNILSDELTTDKTIITLTCLLTQIALYARKIDNKEAFFKEIRAEEISRALNTYFASNDTEICSNLLRLVKADLLVLEYVNGRRDLE